MPRYNQEFKVQSVEKVLSRRSDQSVQTIAKDLGVGYSTLQRWMQLANNNTLEKPEAPMSNNPKSNIAEKSPQDWNSKQRFEAILHCHLLNDEQISSYCRKNGLYPHHIEQWKTDFLSKKQSTNSLSKEEQKKLKQENKRLQKELNRKDKALSETAALLVLSKKCQAIWGATEVD